MQWIYNVPVPHKTRNLFFLTHCLPVLFLVCQHLGKDVIRPMCHLPVPLLAWRWSVVLGLCTFPITLHPTFVRSAVS